MGKLVFHVFAALAEFERDLIRERTTAGLVAARAHTTAEIARRLKVGRSTLYRYLEQEQPIR